MARSQDDADNEPIDYDRVVIDHDYRRTVMRRLRRERNEAPALASRALNGAITDEF